MPERLPARAGSLSRGGGDLVRLQLEVALYVENLSSELRAMARTAELDTLAYFLEMARVEASLQVEARAHGRDTGS
jgi:hypothetical protein